MNIIDKILDEFRPKESGNLLIFSKQNGDVQDIQVLPIDKNDRNIFERIKDFAEKHKNSHEHIYIAKFPIDNYHSLKHKSLKKLISLIYLKPYSSIFLQEALYYESNKWKPKPFTPENIKEYMQKSYADYMDKLQANNLRDCPRTKEFIQEAVLSNPRVLSCANGICKTKKLVDFALRNCSTSILAYLKNDDKTFSICLKDAQKPYFYYALEHLPLNFSKKEITQLILTSVDWMSLSWKKISLDVLYAEAFRRLPKEYLAKYNYSDSFPSKIDSYARTIAKMEINSKQAYEAMEFYASNRFMTAWDPIGADLDGGLTGCEYYIHTGLKNPSDYFSSSKLSPEQWHSIAEINTNIISQLPKEVLQDKRFWNNYESFANKGKYRKHPDNNRRQVYFYDNEIFKYMPENMKTDENILLNLLSKQLIHIRSVENPTEKMYEMIAVTNYGEIPKEIREKENFKTYAEKAVEFDKSNLGWVPVEFITQQMAEKVVEFDASYIGGVPLDLITPKMAEKAINYDIINLNFIPSDMISKATLFKLIENENYHLQRITDKFKNNGYSLAYIDSEIEERQTLFNNLKASLEYPVKIKGLEKSTKDFSSLPKRAEIKKEEILSPKACSKEHPTPNKTSNLKNELTL